jgi:hypothetical protein
MTLWKKHYSMLGTRGMWEAGWKAAAIRAPLSSKGHFDKDEWQLYLYHVDADRSESTDLAKQHPQRLIKAWFEGGQELRAPARRSDRAGNSRRRASQRGSAARAQNSDPVATIGTGTWCILGAREN